MAEQKNRPAWLPLAVGAVVVLGLIIGVRILVSWSPQAPQQNAPKVENRTIAPVPGIVPAEPLGERPETPSESSVPVNDARARVEDKPPPLEGIHVFPPRGTNPLLSGIIVPDDFKLPPGYVRHRQITDDGEPLPAILMFDPRRAPLDSRGEPIPVTPDRIVPPEFAPDGLPIMMLEAPDQREPPTDLSRLLGRE